MIHLVKNPGARRFALVLALLPCYALVSFVRAQEPARPNILVIIGDDMGIETLGSFGVGSDTPTRRQPLRSTRSPRAA